MRKILLIDTNYMFASDLDSHLILEDIGDNDIVAVTKLENLKQTLDVEKPDMLLLAESVIDSHPDWDFGIPVRTYAKTADGVRKSFEKGFETYGIAPTPSDLIDAIRDDAIKHEAPAASAPQKETRTATAEPESTQSRNTGRRRNSRVEPEPEPTQTQGRRRRRRTEPEQEPEPVQTQGRRRRRRAEPETTQRTRRTSYRESAYEDTYDEPDSYYEEEPTSSYDRRQTTRTNTRNTRRTQGNPYEREPAYDEPDPYEDDYQDTGVYARRTEPRPDPPLRRAGTGVTPPKDDFNAAYEVERDMGNIKDKAKAIAIYSAKGGVGKTTIATELASYLAMTSNGKDRYKVCIVDYNIDFGNVLCTLNYDATKACMTVWAIDIRERLNAGELPERINYTEGQISSYLQKNDKSDLYALLAPLTNEDSMEIGDKELEIMLRNVIRNGGFDFVICDTGNNTRDSSIIAIEQADDVVVVLTQDLNAAKDNQGFLNTMAHTGFDLNKVKLVINQAQDAKKVGFSPEELLEAFTKPDNTPYELLTTINFTNDAKKSSYAGEPLVYDSDHPFTKSIGEIASKLNPTTFDIVPPKKRGFFSRLFGRKKNK